MYMCRFENDMTSSQFQRERIMSIYSLHLLSTLVCHSAMIYATEHVLSAASIMLTIAISVSDFTPIAARATSSQILNVDPSSYKRMQTLKYVGSG